ncbi:MAG: response regulator transcription factor [Flammeovirgaceae bacterium]
MIKILYVEDEPFLGRIVKESLESRQFEVKMVSDGEDVLPAFTDYKPDICILDVMLPNKDGFSIAKEIRKINANIPVIFLTAKTQTDDVVKGFELGGNDYIRKPFSMEELIVRIQNLLQIMQKSKSTTQERFSEEKIKIGLYEFFPQRYELKKGEHIRKLSHRETSLLQMLLEAPQSTIQRKDILLKIWGDDSFFNSRNLDVYITKLREYLKDDSSVEILTIKGIGYRIVR